MWQGGLVSFAAGGITTGKLVLFLKLCHCTIKQVQGSVFLHPVISHALSCKCKWLNFCLPVCVSRVTVTGAAKHTRCRAAAAKASLQTGPSSAANSLLLTWVIRLKSGKGAQPTALKRNLLYLPWSPASEKFPAKVLPSVLTRGRRFCSLPSFVFFHVISIYVTKTLGLEEIRKSIPKRNGISNSIAYFPGALIMLKPPNL